MSHIPDDFLQTDLCHDGQRHMIFASTQQLTHLAEAKLWCVDGTFRAVRTPFAQLLSLHSFIRSGTLMKQVPLCFILMSRRQQSDYKVVFEALLRLLPAAPLVQEVMVDFEMAVWNAIRDCMPDVSVHGCAFHWAQAVYRKVNICQYIIVKFYA